MLEVLKQIKILFQEVLLFMIVQSMRHVEHVLKVNGCVIGVSMIINVFTIHQIVEILVMLLAEKW